MERREVNDKDERNVNGADVGGESSWGRMRNKLFQVIKETRPMEEGKDLMFVLAIEVRRESS